MSQCSFQKCTSDASVRVSYKQIGKYPEEPRPLCTPHYETQDENGRKYYQSSTVKVEVLVPGESN